MRKKVITTGEGEKAVVGSSWKTTAGKATQAAMREAAIDLLFKHGYHGVNLRALAEQIGIQAGSLYNHIENKQQLVFDILRRIMEELVEEMTVKLSTTNGTIPRLCAFVSLHLAFHTSRHREVFIGAMELRSLDIENRKVMFDLRARYMTFLKAIVEDGIRDRIFNVSDATIVTFAIIDMLTGVSTWYRKEGRYSTKELTLMYIRMTLGVLGTPTTITEMLQFSEQLSEPTITVGA